MGACCNEGNCLRSKPFLFTKTPDDRWLLVTRYQELGEGESGDRQIRVLERHDVTPQLEAILTQYRAFLDRELTKANQAASKAALERAQKEASKPKLILPGGGL